MFLQVTRYSKDLKPELMEPEPRPFQLVHSQQTLLKLSRFYMCPDTSALTGLHSAHFSLCLSYTECPEDKSPPLGSLPETNLKKKEKKKEVGKRLTGSMGVSAMELFCLHCGSGRVNLHM